MRAARAALLLVTMLFVHDGRERVTTNRRAAPHSVNHIIGLATKPLRRPLRSWAPPRARFARTHRAARRRAPRARTRLVQRPCQLNVPADASNPFAGRSALFLSRLSKVANAPVLLEEIYLDPEHFGGWPRSRSRGAHWPSSSKSTTSCDPSRRTRTSGSVRRAELVAGC